MATHERSADVLASAQYLGPLYPVATWPAPALPGRCRHLHDAGAGDFVWPVNSSVQAGAGAVCDDSADWEPGCNSRPLGNHQVQGGHGERTGP